MKITTRCPACNNQVILIGKASWHIPRTISFIESHRCNLCNTPLKAVKP